MHYIYSLAFVRSAPCCGTQLVPSSGSFWVCNHDAYV